MPELGKGLFARWRGPLIGAGISLIVTIVGGFVVANLPNFNATKVEDLVYSTTGHGSFTGGSQNVAIASLIVSNDGKTAAKGVSVSATFKDAKILDVAFSDVRALRNFLPVRTEHGFSASFDSFLPSESFTINLLLSKSESPDVVLRSDTTMGRPKLLAEEPQDSKSSTKRDLASSLLAAASTAGLFVGLFLIRGSRRERARAQVRSVKEQRFRPSRNNAAFLLLHHQADHSLARKILERALLNGRYDSNVLSNYALCRALDKDIHEAKRLIAAARFLDPVERVLSTVEFNEGVISLIQGFENLAKKHFSNALQADLAFTTKYLQTSFLLGNFRTTAAYKELARQFPKPGQGELTTTTDSTPKPATGES